MVDILIALQWPLIILQLMVSPLLVVLVLLQSGKGDDLGSAFGGGSGGGSSIGSGGSSRVLVKATSIVAILFTLNSVALAKVHTELTNRSVGVEAPEPLAPGEPPPIGEPSSEGEAEETPEVEPIAPPEGEDEGVDDLPE